MLENSLLILSVPVHRQDCSLEHVLQDDVNNDDTAVELPCVVTYYVL